MHCRYRDGNVVACSRHPHVTETMWRRQARRPVRPLASRLPAARVLAAMDRQYHNVLPSHTEVHGVGNRSKTARRVSPRTRGYMNGLETILSTVSSSAARNSPPSPCRRPSYQSRVSTASASACGRKSMRRITRDPVASGALHPKVPQNLDSRRVPSIGDLVQRPPPGSVPVRLHVRRQTDSPKEPSRARLARSRRVSGGRKTEEATYGILASNTETPQRFRRWQS